MKNKKEKPLITPQQKMVNRIGIGIFLFTALCVMLYLKLTSDYYSLDFQNNIQITAEQTEYTAQDATLPEIILTLDNGSRSAIASGSGIMIGCHIYDADGSLLVYDPNIRTEIYSLKPFSSSAYPVTLKLPKSVEAQSELILEFDIVEEGVAWLSTLGNDTERVTLYR